MQLDENKLVKTTKQVIDDITYSLFEGGAKYVQTLELPDGRTAELHILITTDEDEFLGDIENEAV